MPTHSPMCSNTTTERPARIDTEQLSRQALALAGTGTLAHRGDTVIWADDTLAAQLDCPTDELCQRPFHAVVSATSADCLRQQGEACLAGDAPAPIEIDHRAAHGCPRRFEVRARRLADAEGPLALHVFIDITDRPRRQSLGSSIRLLFDQIIRDLPIATFIIDRHHQVTHWNRACERISGTPAQQLLGTRQHWTAFFGEARPLMADLILDEAGDDALNHYYGDRWRRPAHTPDAIEAEGFYPDLGGSARWIYFLAAPLRDAGGKIIAVIETLQDITERKQIEATLEAKVAARTEQLAADIAQREQAELELLKRYAELTELNCQLHDTQEQLVQSERLASIGQLAAGVAHEINNPIGYVLSNITSLRGYLSDIFRLFDAFEALEGDRPADDPALQSVRQLKQAVDFDFLKEDLPALLRESEEGASRVRKIVADLKDFSHADQAQEWVWANLVSGIDSTLNVVNNEIKYKAEVVRQFSELPSVECRPSQLNQVFMNLLVNAAHAITAPGRITITTAQPDAEHVQISISDTGCGMPEDVKARIFEPFFTTKPVGKGTGLGLSLSYGIIQQHRGQIEVDSAPGKGTTFRIILPVRQQAAETPPAAD